MIVECCGVLIDGVVEYVLEFVGVVVCIIDDVVVEDVCDLEDVLCVFNWV